MSRRKKRGFFDEFFGRDLFKEFERFEPEELQSGYSVSVSQSGGRTIVRAKIGKDVDQASFREQLEKEYPGAEIVIEGGKPIIREIETTEKEEKEGRRIRIPIQGEEKPRIKKAKEK
ncbi:MAG: hypothetical protein ACE5OY_02095 [Candidatus Bathyarchaeia archaeon]